MGKTELAKALAALLFDDEKMMVRAADAERLAVVPHTAKLTHL